MQRRQSFLVIAVLVCVALAAAACAKTGTNSNNTNTSTSTSRTSTNTTTTNTTNSSTSTSTANASPTDVFRSVYDAFRNKDAASFKKALSSSDLKDIEEEAKKKGKTVDDFLKALVENPEAAPPPTLETRNEKINGDKATLETKSKSGDWTTINFVKEGGEWKVKMGGDSDGADTMEKPDEHGGDDKN